MQLLQLKGCFSCSALMKEAENDKMATKLVYSFVSQFLRSLLRVTFFLFGKEYYYTYTTTV